MKSTSGKNYKKPQMKDTVVFLWPVFVSCIFGILYVFMQAHGVYGGDSGELVTAAFVRGISHPPGYPLYTFLSGLVIHGLQANSVAWRAGFLSSIPMALSVFFIWKTVYLLTENKVASTISSLLYGLLYPVWLYGIVQEVFGLHAFFSSLVLYVSLLWLMTESVVYLYMLFFLFGLSMTHHHLIIIPFVAVAVTVIWKLPHLIKQIKAHSIACIALFIVGFIPYIYAPIASSYNPPLDIEHPASLVGFIRLFFRASYGTFRAAGYQTGMLIDRILNVTTFFRYAWKDFSVLGVIFIIFAVAELRKRHKIGTFLLLYISLQIAYLFYAGFPVLLKFNLGTLERFFIIPYQIFAVFVGIGLQSAIKIIEKIWKTDITIHIIPARGVVFLVYLICTVYLARTFMSNVEPLHASTLDRRMETYADDLLLSIPQRSIVTLREDTTASAFLYAYYVAGKRQDIAYVRLSLLDRSEYREALHVRYPDIVLPEMDKDSFLSDYQIAFFQKNFPYRPIASDLELSTTQGLWIPHGLVKMYYPTEQDVPDPVLIVQKNEYLWKNFVLPSSGELNRQGDLLLSDINRIYTTRRVSYSGILAYANSGKESLDQLRLSIESDRDNQINLFSDIVSLYINNNQCELAKQGLDGMRTRWNNDFAILSLSDLLRRKCYPDDEQLLEYSKEYESKRTIYDPSVYK
ncbi:DUF2723 domain-containing protein [Patescibacteria group bacterium]|nr:DUF2723 domain-containing protein [Patescibacteria group bacterium]MBU1472435.1 DUF2723 domain-containing protein [Patescibacteria group bacterium]MBU2460250.1 DUF2723 domain-containing protein [Patescibacteria group bacterium]